MTQIPWLDSEEIWFPSPDSALDTPNGLLAAGGDLRSERLIEAYCQGIFPWYEEGQPILWWTPSPRAVLLPGELHISRSLRKTLRKAPFRITADTHFREVIDACSEAREYTEGTWITAEMKEAYCELHRLGVAHCVEAWQGEQLVGGLYGIALDKVFFGESMFSRVTDASKVAFVHLVGQLEQWGFQLIDCQVSSEHLNSLGAREIPRHQFQQLLIDYIERDRIYSVSKEETNLQKHWRLTYSYQ